MGNWIWLIVGLSTIVGAIIVLLGILHLLMAMFFPHKLALQYKSKAKRRQLSIEANGLAKKYNAPSPPILYCPDCGSLLTYDYVYWRKNNSRDIRTGEEQFEIVIEYQCTNGHYPGSAGTGMHWWSNWGSSQWNWVA